MKSFLQFIAASTLTVLVIYAAFVMQPSAPRAAGPTDDDKVRGALSYLSEVDGVAWVKVKDRTAYVGWRSRPSDHRAIINGAASAASASLSDKNVYVYSVDQKQDPLNDSGWRFFCSAIGRDGRVTEFCK